MIDLIATKEGPVAVSYVDKCEEWACAYRLELGAPAGWEAPDPAVALTLVAIVRTCAGTNF